MIFLLELIFYYLIQFIAKIHFHEIGMWADEFIFDGDSLWKQSIQMMIILLGLHYESKRGYIGIEYKGKILIEKLSLWLKGLTQSMNVSQAFYSI
ncbi:hypothetical protein ACJX0J_020337, partial [Zea mays]